MEVSLKNDFDLAISIIRAAAAWRYERGFPSGQTWDLENVNLDFLLREYNAKPENFFVMYADGIPALAFIFQDHDGDGMWSRHEDGKRHYYLTKLGAAPENHGKGYADELLKKLQEKAAIDGACSIRLDTGAHQPGLMRLYERNGFEKKGIYHSKSTGLDWVLYEWATLTTS